MASRIQRVEDRLLQFCLIGAAITSVGLNIVGVDARWYAPGIFMALYGMFRILTEMHERDLGVESTFYRTNSEFYAATQKRMQVAKSHIWVHVRTIPPPGFESAEANSYFKYTVDWARRNPDREFRRIFGAADSGPMAAWLARHHEETREIRNYRVCVVPFHGKVDEINLAIVDDSAVFLAVSGDGNSMTGHSLETPDAVHAFREYYLQKWNTGESLEEYVRRTREGGLSSDLSSRTR
ncbi:MAG TPA: hypothetical protein VIV12_20295 [Streptosporangiaceae bacterium]